MFAAIEWCFKIKSNKLVIIIRLWDSYVERQNISFEYFTLTRR